MSRASDNEIERLKRKNRKRARKIARLKASIDTTSPYERVLSHVAEAVVMALPAILAHRPDVSSFAPAVGTFGTDPKQNADPGTEAEDGRER